MASVIFDQEGSSPSERLSRPTAIVSRQLVLSDRMDRLVAAGHSAVPLRRNMEQSFNNHIISWSTGE
jgi:hypothetical protein